MPCRPLCALIVIQITGLEEFSPEEGLDFPRVRIRRRNPASRALVPPSSHSESFGLLQTRGALGAPQSWRAAPARRSQRLLPAVSAKGKSPSGSEGSESRLSRCRKGRARFPHDGGGRRRGVERTLQCVQKLCLLHPRIWW